MEVDVVVGNCSAASSKSDKADRICFCCMYRKLASVQISYFQQLHFLILVIMSTQEFFEFFWKDFNKLIGLVRRCNGND